VRPLLDRGADVNSKDNKWGRTTLLEAANRGHEAVVRLLLGHGADVNAKNEWGQTALHEAAYIWKELYREASRGYEAVVQLLLDRGTDINAKDDDGRTGNFSRDRGGGVAAARPWHGRQCEGRWWKDGAT
jgi:ankyrin repeat protein